ncbi:MAG TPA: hypothetical protein G4N96_00945 [Chloroflexi bacterium]|nr:MAG: hypothetical protein B6243_01440 [Anaerolineaceae bacterium 4572_5.2]HEY83668.1 hypothetical protein [Chloroflexota bacterium]
MRNSAFTIRYSPFTIYNFFGKREQTPIMNKQQLLTLIDQAAKDDRTELDLSSRGLTELPPEIGQLTELEWLDLNSTQLSAPLPPWLSKERGRC